jgi:hypothetical protein
LVLSGFAFLPEVETNGSNYGYYDDPSVLFHDEIDLGFILPPGNYLSVDGVSTLAAISLAICIAACRFLYQLATSAKTSKITGNASMICFAFIFMALFA